MPDRRETIIEAAMSLLREEGYAAFTQPNVARLAGLRQSHLTYYYPTRSDLLAAVAQVAVDRQLAGAGQLPAGGSTREIAAGIARLVASPANTRVILALVSAADQEPAVRDQFRRLAAGMREKGAQLLEQLGDRPPSDGAALLHALSIGLAIINFATAQANGEQHIASLLETELNLVVTGNRK